MDQTPRLALPFIMPQQAQKHITHNEALSALDALVQPVVQTATTTTPPSTPLAGEAHLVPAGASGPWAGHADEIAIWQANAWQFHDPAPGWQVFVAADHALLVFDNGAWTPLMGLGGSLKQLGIATTADATNRFAVAAPATLLTHAGAGHQLKLNKATAVQTGSLLFQTNFSGRAEMGLMGDDNWHIKVSANGTSWVDALTVNAATGVVTTAASLRPASDNAVTLGASGARWSAIWSATGTIQTSDARQKTDVKPCDLGLDFIAALKPVRYRRLGETGPDGHRAKGKRLHYGLLAQQVLDALDGKDFAGYVLADPTDPGSDQGLRYDSFIAPLITAIQELAARVKALEVRS